MAATICRIGDTDMWASSVCLRRFLSQQQRDTRVALHFVIDNSASMGSLTAQVTKTFAGLVDSAATRPCSLTLFSEEAKVLSDNIETTAQMLALPSTKQGATNIPAGVRKAMGVIESREKTEESMHGNSNSEKTHHFLILLTDGMHNRGPKPETEFPLLRKECQKIPNIQLSVVVVGVTRNSSTAMGMQLKTSIETVPLEESCMRNIYFAATRQEMSGIAAKLIDGLQNLAAGSVCTLSYPETIFVSDIGSGRTDSVKVRITQRDATTPLLLEAKSTPNYICVNGVRIKLEEAFNPDHTLISDVLRYHLNRVRVKRVASSSSSIRSALREMSVLIDALDAALKAKGASLMLKRAGAKERLSRHRHVTQTLYMARELRNQMADVANFTAKSSEEQANFLTGGHGKYANKAMRRAAARKYDDMVIDPETELARVHNEIGKQSYAASLRNRLRLDTITHVGRLSGKQVKQLEDHIRAVSKKDFLILKEFMAKFPGQIAGAAKKPELDKEDQSAPRSMPDMFEDVPSRLMKFIDSGALSNCLNQVFFGGEHSYLSLSTPWEHIAEWADLHSDNVDFRSLWEMLLYVGSVGYPIVVERSAATQMNPFELKVKNVHTTMIDTASLCCANHSETDIYGPEAGEPIKDALVLIDPSCPTASAMIASSALLGEAFTSVVLSRDLYMYTGASMKVAILAHSLFRCLQAEPEKRPRSDLVADIRRQFLGTAYQCGSCGFGPVDHGGCSDLFAHHGEHNVGGGVASNSCPLCGWFSEDLADWEPWDGKVHESLLTKKVGGNDCSKNNSKPLETKMDMVLRIVYSFRKAFQGTNNPIRVAYRDFAKKLVGWDLSFTAQDDVDSPVQLLLAAMACDDDVMGNKKDIDAAFAPPVLLAVVNEACARAARKKFRMAAKGDEIKARKLAVDRVTEMFGITEESAPNTTESLLDPEPKHEVVEENCKRHYTINSERSAEELSWVEKLATRWCRALTFAKALRIAIVKRGGGWDQLEWDMETSLENYADVVHELQNALLTDPKSFCDMCEIPEQHRTRTLAAMAAQAFLYNKGAHRKDLIDVRSGEACREIAKDLRMQIYSERVKAKLAQWADQGEQLVFFRARAADITQYAELVAESRHVHGLNKETFWGLWEAAVSDPNLDKAQAFLATANDTFRGKYALDPRHIYYSKKSRQRQARI